MVNLGSNQDIGKKNEQPTTNRKPTGIFFSIQGKPWGLQNKNPPKSRLPLPPKGARRGIGYRYRLTRLTRRPRLEQMATLMAQNFKGLTTAMIHFLSMQTHRLCRWRSGSGECVGWWGRTPKKENRRKEGTPCFLGGMLKRSKLSSKKVR